ncbi:MAG: undecaprenyl-diphosphate phosphatase [Nitrospirota bacterium]
MGKDLDLISIILLSVIQGLTEFLPVSSTGHLILTSHLLDLSEGEFVKSFEIAIQLGSIFSIIFLYFRRLAGGILLWSKVLIAFIPTGVLGFLFYKIIKYYLLGNPYVVVISLVLGGIALIILELTHKEKFAIEMPEDISYLRAFSIGLFQSLSMIPGVSRAGATIIGGLLLGLKRKSAVEFSFFLAVPTMFAAVGYDLIKTGSSFTIAQWKTLGIGFIISFIVAAVAVKTFLRFISKYSFIPFGIYRILIGLVYWMVVLK